MKILWTTNIPSPYRVDFFNELGKKCELTVIFERKISSERDKSWGQYNFTNFEGILLKGIKVGTDKAINLQILKYIKKNNYDYVIVSNPLTPTGMLAIQALKLLKIPFSIEGDGGFPSDSENKSVRFKEALKEYILKGANTYFSTADMHDQYFISYGADRDKIVRYPFTSIKSDDILDERITQKDKKELKARLGIKEDKVVLSVGRFTYGKGYDVLIKACALLKEDVGIYIVGGNPTAEYLKLKNKYNLANLHFMNFKNKQELDLFYKAADVFVLPTRRDVWGLVINEAMAQGLPVITTDKCIAGLEMIENSKNGFIVPVENYVDLAEKINEVLINETTLKIMGEENLKKIKDYTIEKMAERHIEIIEGNNKYV